MLKWIVGGSKWCGVDGKFNVGVLLHFFATHYYLDKFMHAKKNNVMSVFIS